MNHPDDHVHAKAPFYGDETGEIFAIPEEQNQAAQFDEHSFEIQSGFLIVVQRLSTRLALSFKRQIGTPPSSSIFLTNDEARRLANVLLSSFDLGYSYRQTIRTDRKTRAAEHLQETNNVVMHLAILIGNIALCTVIAIFAYQMQFHHGH